MSSLLEPEYEGGIPVFRPSYDEFRDFRRYVNSIEPIGMTSGIVKIIPPIEWKSKLPQIPSARVDKIEIKNPIIQNITIDGGRGIFGIDNIEKRRKFTVRQWLKECDSLNNQPPVKRGSVQGVLGKFSAPEGEFVSYDDTDFRDPEILAELEAKYWKGLSYGGAPMYGADMLGSLFEDKTTEWNIAHLDSLLSVLPEGVPGVTEAYLYCGMWRATFSWHLEDVDLPSINYIHFGAPKQWYTIPQEFHKKFYDLMAAIWPEQHQSCSEFLRHKTFLADPAFISKHGIPVNKIVHHQGEFIITFPFGYHAGFNYGFNVAESVNFAHDSWLKIGPDARKCTCVEHSVGIDVKQLVEFINNPEKAREAREAAEAAKSLATAAVLSSARAASRDPSRRQSSRPVSTPSPAVTSRAQYKFGKCALCPHIYNGEYIQNAAGTASVHTLCAILTPETWVEDGKVHGLEYIDHERFTLKCGECKKKHGTCFQCASLKCTRAYHGSCAAAAGVDYARPNEPLCRTHRNKSKVADLYYLPGDTVQYCREKRYYGGIVKVNDLDNKLLTVGTLPNPAETDTVKYEEIVSVFDELPSTLKRQHDGTESDVKKVKENQEEGPHLRQETCEKVSAKLDIKEDV